MIKFPNISKIYLHFVLMATIGLDYPVPFPQLDIFKSHCVSFSAVMSWNPIANLRDSIGSTTNYFIRRLGNYLLYKV